VGRRVTVRALIVRNPAARRQFDAANLDAAIAVARNAGWRIDVAATGGAGDAIHLARDAAEAGVSIVVANGGDGTVNEVMNGIAGTDAALVVLPGGTANVWAKETGIPRDPIAAMRAIVNGERRRVDVGRANGRAFLLMAGIGLDAVIVRRASPGLKRRIGAAAYIVAGAIAAIRTKPWRADVTVDGAPSSTELYWMLASNTRNYGGVVEIAHRAVADDGLLESAIMRRGGLHLLPDAVRVFRKRIERSPNVAYSQSRTIEIATPRIPYQLDGEPCGETPLTLTIDPLALTAIVPPGIRTPLFTRPPLHVQDAI
jgi:YegS/Rv2252/BmrU family lipid kinase